MYRHSVSVCAWGSIAIAVIWQPLQKLLSTKNAWSWGPMQQDIQLNSTLISNDRNKEKTTLCTVLSGLQKGLIESSWCAHNNYAVGKMIDSPSSRYRYCSGSPLPARGHYPQYKTDHFWQGIQLFIGKTSSEVCRPFSYADIMKVDSNYNVSEECPKTAKKRRALIIITPLPKLSMESDLFELKKKHYFSQFSEVILN